MPPARRTAKPSPRPSPRGRGRKTASPKKTAANAQVPAHPQPIYVLSDSTGNLGRHVLTAILTQFPPHAFRLETRSFLRSEQQLNEVMEQVAADENALVFHGLLDHAHKRLVNDRCRQAKVPVCDLTGPFVDFLSEHSGLTPGKNYDLLHRVDESYKRRIKALEFTLEHDDALGLETIGEADIILVGVSRTSKTPTSVYLAQLGYRVANVAIAIQVQPPRELLELKQRKVVGLVIQPRTLAEIRARRQQEWRMDPTAYTDPREVAREVAWSRQLFQRQGWPILDITNQAVEETAGRIVHLLGLTQPRPES